MEKFDKSKRCPNCPKNSFLLYHPEKDKIIFPGCKSYACPEDGWKRRKELREGLETWLKTFKLIRFWTFTLSSKNYESNHEHYRDLAQTWRFFITYLRRSKVFTKAEQEVQYVKIYEQHQSGYLHIHAFFSDFVEVQKAYVLWNAAARAATGKDEARGYCYVRAKSNVEQAARYVVKYVTKLAHFKTFFLRKWSKSGKVAIFKKFKTEKGWLFMLRDHFYNNPDFLSLPLLEVSKNKCTKPPPLPPETGALFEFPEGYLLYEPDYPY